MNYSVEGPEDDFMQKTDEKSQDWSFTKSLLYDSCPRAFFLSRGYTVHKGKKKSRPTNRAINIGALIGVAVHRSIAMEIKRWVDGKSVDIKEAKIGAEEWLNDMWDNSKAMIIEASNGQKLNTNINILVNSANKHIQTFFMFVWPRFSSHSYVLHEKSQNFKIDEYTVWVKVDLCTRDSNGNIIITDWKTGVTHFWDIDKPQLSIYAIWAMEQYKVPIEKIIIQIANIKTGEVNSKRPSNIGLKEIKELILKECKMWESQDISNFPAKQNFKKCISCRYLKSCDIGQETLESATEF